MNILTNVLLDPAFNMTPGGAADTHFDSEVLSTNLEAVGTLFLFLVAILLATIIVRWFGESLGELISEDENTQIKGRENLKGMIIILLIAGAIYVGEIVIANFLLSFF